MRLPDDFWTVRPDEDTSLGAFIGAAAVMALFIIALYLWLVTGAVAA